MITDRKAAADAALYPPHIKHPDSVRSMMIDVLIALAPAGIWGIYSFGARAFLVMLISVLTAVAAETAFDHVTKRPFSISDFSAVVTGLLFSFLLPAGVPLYVPLIGSAFAIVIVKCVFGGLGCNMLNPALAGYVFAKLCFPSAMTVEGDSLAVLKAGDIPDIPLYDMLIGNIPGSIGEVSALLLIAGGVYLIIRGIIDWRVPVTFIGCVAAVTFMMPNNINGLAFMEYELFSGALVLVAVFMATDPVTSPVTWLGRIIFGILCGGLTVLLRYYGRDAEGVIYAVLTMNLLSDVIDRILSTGKGKISYE